MSLLELRKQQKQKFADYLQQITLSSTFQSKFEVTIGKHYKMIQYQKCYKHQALQILSYQFSSMGGTNHAKILQLSVNDHYRSLSLELDHVANTGMGILIIDKNNNVCYIAYMWDQCDRPIFNIENANFSKKHQICSAAMKNDPVYRELVLSPKNSLQYGDIMVREKAATRPDLIGKGFVMFDLSGGMGILLGYKYEFSLQTNLYTQVLGDAMCKFKSPMKTWRRTSYFDFSKFTFDNGTNMQQCYQRLGAIGYNVDKLKIKYSKVAVLLEINLKKVSIEQAIEIWPLVLDYMKNIKRKSKI